MARVAGFSDGHDGAVSITSTADLSPLYRHCYGNAGDYIINLPSGTDDIDVGDKILILQSQTGNVGNHEMNIVKGKTVNTLTLVYPLEVNYTFFYRGDHAQYYGAQVVLLNQYSTVDIGAGGVVSCAHWRGGGSFFSNNTLPVGGIIAFAAHKLNLTGGGMIDATGKGFWGGVLTPYNWARSGESINSIGTAGGNAINEGGGGGGGNGASDAMSGGGGGGYGTAGGRTDCNGACRNRPTGGNAIGGATLKNDFYLGSGGGGSIRTDGDPFTAGGEGGGGIIIFANEVDISDGWIKSNGVYNQSVSGMFMTGGGGAGGPVKIVCNTAKLGNNRAMAVGGQKAHPSNNGGPGGFGRFRPEVLQKSAQTYFRARRC